MASNMVATSQPLAAQAGLRILLRGGNAVDAAIATAAVLTVVEPTSNGLGSDAFALVWTEEDGRLHGLNGSGRSPGAWSYDHFAPYPVTETGISGDASPGETAGKGQGRGAATQGRGSGTGTSPGTRSGTGTGAMPVTGWDTVTVPGAVSAWAELSERFGKLPFGELLEPAIHYARHGFPVSPITARVWALAPTRYAGMREFCETFLPGGAPPLPGHLFRNPHLARTLDLIALRGADVFYRGEIADRIIKHATLTGGLLSHEDLASHASEWVEPLGMDFRGYTLHEIPPNGQGIAALEALGILGQFGDDPWGMDHSSWDRVAIDHLHPLSDPLHPSTDPPRHQFEPIHPLAAPSHPLSDSYHPPTATLQFQTDTLHLQIEAMKLALADTHAHVGDPRAMTVAPIDLLSRGYLRERAALIHMGLARNPGHGIPGPGGTVSLVTADEAGMMVSFIQSNYMGFGSGIVVPGTGIALQNRGSGFSPIRGHPNQVDGGKRPFHTIIPAFVTRQDHGDGGWGMEGVNHGRRGATGSRGSGDSGCQGRISRGNGHREAVMAFGVMGGPMQPQGHVQMMIRMFALGQDPQTAIDAPRWQVFPGMEVALEPGFPREVVDALAARGHRIRQGLEFWRFGGAQAICRLDRGESGGKVTYAAGSDPRKDGQAVGY